MADAEAATAARAEGARNRARPAGTEIDPEIFARIKRLQIRTRRTVTEVMAGEYESAFKGRGMEFEQVREYQPGDDVRHIDWNVTARLGAPHVKEHREERELTVMLLVDLSASGRFGSSDRSKNEVAAEVAAVLAYTAVRNHDRVGLILLTDHVEHYIPPKRGATHVWRVIREILAFRPTGRGTDLAGALEYLSRVTRRRSVVFVLSDFQLPGPLPAAAAEAGDDEPFARRLRSTARRHDITAVVLTDPRERELPNVGLVTLEDAESGRRVLVDTGSRRVRDAFRREAERRRLARRDLFRSAGVGELSLTAGEPYADPLMRYFRAREKKR